MVNPWMGMGFVIVLFAALMSGLRAYRHWSSPDPEVLRKLLHIGMGLVTLSFPCLFAASWPVLLLTVVFTLLLALLRVSPAMQRLLGGVIDGVRRDSMGEIYFPLAVGMVFLLSAGEPVTFCIPILILALADAAAALIGRRYGTLRYATVHGVKSVEGSVAFLAVAFLSTHLPLLLFTETGPAESLLIALTVALLVMLLEAVAWRGLDNLFIPLGAFVLLSAFLELDVTALATRLSIAVSLVAACGIACRRRAIVNEERVMISRNLSWNTHRSHLGGVAR